MENTNTNNPRTLAADREKKAAANAAKLEKMRANLARLETTAAAILEKGDSMTADDRRALLALVNFSYHDSGKIEGCFSLDSCACCDFCQRMISAAAGNILMICGSCYAEADAWKEAARRRHTLNMKILSGVLFTVEELKTLTAEAAADAFPNQADTLRINEDGDTVNEIHGRNYLRTAAGAPWLDVGYWYKNAPAVSAALAAEGYTTRESLPENVRFIHSSALIGFPARGTWFDDGIFTVWPDAETTAAAIRAGAHACNGRRCRECKYFCYRMKRQAAPVHIAEVLRTNKAKRAAILAAYNARKAQQAQV